jgi:putative Holliday junction resolvase
MKTLALDIGDVWTGSATSDSLGITCSPYKTIKAHELETFIAETLKNIVISTIVIGYPKTMSGTESIQTKKVVALKNILQEKFPDIKWVLWDERLSSKRAERLSSKKPSKKDKIHGHSQAAAFILQSYLDSIAFNKS